MGVSGAKACIAVTGGTLQLNRGGGRQPATHDGIGHLQVPRPALLNGLQRNVGQDNTLQIVGYLDAATWHVQPSVVVILEPLTQENSHGPSQATTVCGIALRVGVDSRNLRELLAHDAVYGGALLTVR